MGRLLRAWLSVCLDVDPAVWWSVALWPVVPWGGVKIFFWCTLGNIYGIRILRYLYLSKVFNSLLFRQLLRHKVLAHECNATFSAISMLGWDVTDVPARIIIALEGLVVSYSLSAGCASASIEMALS